MDYETQIQTIFNSNCTNCHVYGHNSGLNLASYTGVMAGGNSGAVIVPGDHANSLLWQKVNSGVMPPGNNPDLSADEINLIAQWIDEGALETHDVAFQPQTKQELQTAVDLWVSDNDTALETYGEINEWDVSLITDMSMLFNGYIFFNDDISSWDVSNVTIMEGMFESAENFNQDLSSWDVSNVTDMRWMFALASSFNEDLSTWNVSNVTDMMEMFEDADSFNQDLSAWDVSSVTDIRQMFSNATRFNQDISAWDVSGVTNMESMFYHASDFNQDISAWDVSSVTDMGNMFEFAAALSDENKCAIHTSFQTNSNWSYDWESLCTTHCVRIITGPESDDQGTIDVIVYSTNDDIISSLSGDWYDNGETVLDECFPNQIGNITVHNPTNDGWRGSMEISYNGIDYAHLECIDCTGSDSSSAFFLVDGNASHGANTECLNGDICTFIGCEQGWNECGECGSDCLDCAGVFNGDAELDNCDVCDSDFSNNNTTCCSTAYGETCILIETGTETDDNGGNIDIYVQEDDNILHEFIGQHYNAGDVVLDTCFGNVQSLIVTGPTTNAWAGSIQVSIDGGANYNSMLCDNCTNSNGGSIFPTTFIVIDGNELYDLILGSSEGLVLNGNVSQFIISNNILHDCDNIGIDFIGFENTAPISDYDQTRNGIVSNNTIYNISSFGNPAYGNLYSAGGVYVDGGRDIVIKQNTISQTDIGIEIASEHHGKATSYITVKDNLLYNNRMAGIAMGGYDAERGSTENCFIINNTLYNNDTLEDGNGEILLQYDTQDNIIKNNIFYANDQGLMIGNPFTENINNVVDYNLYFSSAGITDSEWEWQSNSFQGFNTYTLATGNDSHSLFLDPLFTDPANGDYTLQAGSPCIDAGIVIEDMEYCGEAPDMGAYEYITEECEELSFTQETPLPIHYSLNSAYPNPFNPATTISFSIPEFGLTTITAYDITGRQLETLTNEVLTMGNYSINWNASSYPSGVYLIRMESGEFTQTQKMVLVK